MRSDSFQGYEIEPSDLLVFVWELLTQNGFNITAMETAGGVTDLHARRAMHGRVTRGAVRDIDVVLAHSEKRIHLQLRVGIWGRDLLVPSAEGIPAAGVATVDEVQSAQELEKDLWERLVHWIDPALLISESDGLTFKAPEELKFHTEMHNMLREGMQGERAGRNGEITPEEEWLKQLLEQQLPGLDCGSCGHQSCAEFAAAMVYGGDSVERCVTMPPDVKEQLLRALQRAMAGRRIIRP